LEEIFLLNNIIEAVDLHYKYPDNTHAIKGLSIRVEKGKKIGIVGPNGAGKTTLFLHLNGVYKPFSGKIFFEGKEIKYNKREMIRLRSKVGIVFQDSNVQLFSSSVFQEISFGPMNLGLSEDEVKARVEKVIDQLDIRNLRDRPTHFLSGGEKKKVSIAAILSMEPEVIILDEPLANLDPKSAKDIMGILEGLNEDGKTIIISTHDVNSIYSWADYIYIINDGKILKEGKPQEIFEDTKVLKSANLQKPWIVDVFEQIIKSNPEIKEQYPLPRSKKELFEMLGKLKIKV
jgi:cobalt/nickel transport system ATP-binding protein